jgi:hypothetical protein
MAKKASKEPSGGFASGAKETMSVRLSPDLREKLEAAARTEGTTISAQLENRLAASFENTEHTAAVLRVFGEVLRRLSAASGGENWADNPWLYGQVEAAFSYLFEQWRPTGEAVKPTLRVALDDNDRLGRFVAQGLLMEIAFNSDDQFGDLGSLMRR